MTELGIDARLDLIKAEEAKTSGMFFQGELSGREAAHRQVVLWVEKIKLQGIKDYAEFHGLDPDRVSVTTDIDHGMSRDIYSVQP